MGNSIIQATHTAEVGESSRRFTLALSPDAEQFIVGPGNVLVVDSDGNTITPIVPTLDGGDLLDRTRRLDNALATGVACEMACVFESDSSGDSANVVLRVVPDPRSETEEALILATFELASCPEGGGTALYFEEFEQKWESDIVWGAGAGSGGSGGAFYTLYVDGDGDTYLQGGTVSGGHGGSKTVADEKVLDSVDGVDGKSGDVLYVVVGVTATVADEVMLPGLKVNSASLSSAGSVPTNATLTATSKTGNLYLELGRWTDTTFLPAYPGHVQAGGCPGNYFLNRG